MLYKRDFPRIEFCGFGFVYRAVSRPLCGIICPLFFECLKIRASRNSRAHVLKSQARHPSTSFRLTFFAASSRSYETGKAKTKKSCANTVQSQPTRKFPLSLARFKTFFSLFLFTVCHCDAICWFYMGKVRKTKSLPLLFQSCAARKQQP